MKLQPTYFWRIMCHTRPYLDVGHAPFSLKLLFSSQSYSFHPFLFIPFSPMDPLPPQSFSFHFLVIALSQKLHYRPLVTILSPSVTHSTQCYHFLSKHTPTFWLPLTPKLNYPRTFWLSPHAKIWLPRHPKNLVTPTPQNLVTPTPQNLVTPTPQNLVTPFTPKFGYPLTQAVVLQTLALVPLTLSLAGVVATVFVKTSRKCIRKKVNTVIMNVCSNKLV